MNNVFLIVDVVRKISDSQIKELKQNFVPVKNFKSLTVLSRNLIIPHGRS